MTESKRPVQTLSESMLLNTPSPRIMVVDLHPVVRKGVVSILEPAFGNLKITGCGNFTDAFHYLGKHSFDLVISDFRIHGETALSFVQKLVDSQSATRCLIFSALDEIQVGYPCIRAGAYGFVNKTSPPAEIVDAVRTTLDGRHYVSDRLAKALMNHHGTKTSSSSPGTHLTTRELQIFSLIGESLSVSKIASKLGLSVKTVEAHRENIKNKLGHPSAAHLAAAAVRWLDDTSVAI